MDVLEFCYSMIIARSFILSIYNSFKGMHKKIAKINTNFSINLRNQREILKHTIIISTFLNCRIIHWFKFVEIPGNCEAFEISCRVSLNFLIILYAQNVRYSKFFSPLLLYVRFYTIFKAQA